MSDTIDIPQGGTEVHVFALELDGPQAEDFVAEPDGDGWPLKVALGAQALNATLVDYFPVSDLAGLGLAGYLIEGLGCEEAPVEADRAALDAVTGHVVILRPGAAGPQAATLVPRPPLRYIGSYPEARPETTMERLHTPSAEGTVQTQVTPGPAPTPRLLKIAAAVAAALIVIGILAVLTGGSE